MHGAPVTVHVTSPTRRLLSLIMRVVDIGPLMSSASTALDDKRTPMTTARRQTHNLLAHIEHALSEWLKNRTAELLLYTIIWRVQPGFSFAIGGTLPGKAYQSGKTAD